MRQNNAQGSAYEIAEPSPRRRLKILKIVALAAFGIIALRLFFIQIVEHDNWVARANDQHTLLETIAAKRGEIYMMDHGEPVAVVLNQSTYQVVIDPTVTEKEDIEKVIKDYVKDYTIVNIDEVYDTENLRYAVVATNVPRDTAEKIAESGIPAIWLKKVNKRVYPEGELASGLLGFVNNDGVGQYGVEGSLNKALAGEDGLLKTIADVNKVALSIGDNNVKIPAKDGENVVLSIDRGLQQGVEEIAARTLQSSPATNASVLVMNPNNGEVLTMANLPNYDPSNYGNVKDASAFLNYITEVPYEPASICKSFAYSAALEEGVMSAATTYLNRGYEIIDGSTIANSDRSRLLGTVDMKTALYWSFNTGSIYALKLLGGDTEKINQKGREKLYDYYYNKFHLAQETGIEIAEATGYLIDPNADLWGLDAAYANMTFGQNLGITMIQTATAWSAVINGGIYHTPRIIKGVVKNGALDEAGASEIAGSDEKKEERILSEETSAAMREMLINNRSFKVRGGIDKRGYALGGKTGTAQVIIDGAYDATMKNTIGSYIGFVGPEGELPKYVIMVKMWGEGQALEGTHAALLFDELSHYVIDYYKIKPKV